MSSQADHSKFPGQVDTGLPPPPSIYNPGQVFPKSDPSKAIPPPLSRQNSERYIANPFLMNEAFSKLDHAIGEVIGILENEEGTAGSDNRLLMQFYGWRNQIDSLRTGKSTPARTPARVSPDTDSSEGGLFVD